MRAQLWPPSATCVPLYASELRRRCRNPDLRLVTTVPAIFSAGYGLIYGYLLAVAHRFSWEKLTENGSPDTQVWTDAIFPTREPWSFKVAREFFKSNMFERISQLIWSCLLCLTMRSLSSPTCLEICNRNMRRLRRWSNLAFDLSKTDTPAYLSLRYCYCGCCCAHQNSLAPYPRKSTCHASSTVQIQIPLEIDPPHGCVY